MTTNTARARSDQRLSRGLTVRLDAGTLAKLQARAAERGVGAATLARTWLLERLLHEEEKAAGGRVIPKRPAGG